MKKFGLFGDNDLFFAKKLKPLADQTKMRKFQGSRILGGFVVLIAAYIPYWIYANYYNKQIVIKYNIKNTQVKRDIANDTN